MPFTVSVPVVSMDWEQLEPYVRKMLATAVDRLRRQLPDSTCQTCNGDGYFDEGEQRGTARCPTCDGNGVVAGQTVRAAMDITVNELYGILEKRGRVYGEDVLALLGETGFVVMAVTKTMRILWGYEHDQPAESREDSWLDLAGYGILCVALQRFLASGGKLHEQPKA